MRSQRCYLRNGFKVIDEKESTVGTLNITRDRVLMEYLNRDDR